MWKFFATIIFMLFVLVLDGFSHRIKKTTQRATLPRQEIMEKCLQYIHTSDCRFYDCFYERYPCPELLGMKLKNIYCSLSLIEHDDLYREENYWLKSIIDCFMFSLAPSYVSESLNCNLLKSRVLRIQRECYTQGNICEVGWKNREGLWHLYSYAMTSLTQRYEWVWYNIAVIASNCTAPIGVELSKWINSHIIP